MQQVSNLIPGEGLYRKDVPLCGFTSFVLYSTEADRWYSGYSSNR
jgi:hypothetical protein